jgi:hypothetical protein
VKGWIWAYFWFPKIPEWIIGNQKCLVQKGLHAFLGKAVIVRQAVQVDPEGITATQSDFQEAGQFAARHPLEDGQQILVLTFVQAQVDVDVANPLN